MVKNNPKKQNAGLFESVEKAVLQVLLTVVFSLIKVLKWSKFFESRFSAKTYSFSAFDFILGKRTAWMWFWHSYKDCGNF